MREYFSKQVKYDDKLPIFIPHSNMQYVKKEDINLQADILTLKEKSYLLYKNMPKDSEGNSKNIVLGYLSAIKKRGKSKKLSRYAKAVLSDEDIYYELQKKSDKKIIGYLKTTGENRFIAVTESRGILLLLMFLLWLIPVLLFLTMLIPQNYEPIFNTDKVTEGTITSTDIAELKPDYFNIKINATPILESGKMNIRIENSKRNIYDCYVEISLEDGKVIYTSPILSPNQSLEYATVNADIPVGSYNGVAVFRYIDKGEELKVQSSVKLVIGVR